ncbi:MAG: DNA-binding domain-containing protein [Acidobacteriota bacterium]
MNLAELQATFLRGVRDPGGEAGHAAEALVVSSGPGLVTYSGAYWTRLLEAARELFPVTRATAGDEVFDALVSDYLQAHPPAGTNLTHLGADLAEHLGRTRPRNEDWAELLEELVVFEQAVLEVFDGPGEEERSLLAPEALARFTPESWLAAVLVPVPSLRLLRFRHRVSEHWLRVRAGGEATPTEEHLAPSEEYLTLTRQDYRVRRQVLPAASWPVLSALVDGRSVGDALSELRFDDHPELDLETAVGEWFRSWCAAGFFLDVSET